MTAEAPAQRSPAQRSRPTRRALLGLAAATVTGAVAGSGCGRAATPPGPARRPRASSGLTVSLPAPTGSHPIGTVDLHLVDRSRPDPLVPSKPYRELMISLWYPAVRRGRHAVAPWMSPRAAADWDRNSAPTLGVAPGTVDWAGIPTHARSAAPVARDAGQLPIVLFAPGDGGTRGLGTTLVEDLASRGHLVLTVDHTYEADQVEFPGGRVERALPLPDELTPQVIADLLVAHQRARVADMTYVLGLLGRLDRGHSPDADGTPLPDGLRGALDLSAIGLLGQSLGGSVAAQLAHDDERVGAAVDLDGGLFGTVARTGLAKPFLLLDREEHHRDNEPTWTTFWAASTGWRREVRFADAQHGSFSDLQAILPQLGGHADPAVTAELIGTADPRRSIAAQRAYVAAFFDLHLKHRRTRFFDDADAYPEGTRVVP
ncbi:alpha/beta hydrolase family protein [Streptomyces sp. NPDC058417]|uniref:alpha/beta hydrolase family protein n=1 Tax=unclassified Streptomyces TaxID=2593676 RepID=UPI00366536F1